MASALYKLMRASNSVKLSVLLTYCAFRRFCRCFFGAASEYWVGLCPFLVGWIAPAFGYRVLFLVMVPVVAASYVVYMAFRRAGIIAGKKK